MRTSQARLRKTSKTMNHSDIKQTSRVWYWPTYSQTTLCMWAESDLSPFHWRVSCKKKKKPKDIGRLYSRIHWGIHNHTWINHSPLSCMIFYSFVVVILTVWFHLNDEQLNGCMGEIMLGITWFSLAVSLPHTEPGSIVKPSQVLMLDLFTSPLLFSVTYSFIHSFIRSFDPIHCGGTNWKSFECAWSRFKPKHHQ